MEELEKVIEDVDGKALSKILLKMWKESKKEVAKLRVVSIIATVLATVSIVLCTFMGVAIDRQAGELRAIHSILDAGVVIEETTTTTTTTEEVVNQDTGEGSGNNIYQSGENATYTQTGGE